MAIIDFPSTLSPQLEDATGCFFGWENLLAQAPGGRGVVQVAQHGSPGRWSQSGTFNLSANQWRELRAVLARVRGGIDQLRAPDFYQEANRVLDGWSADAPLSSDGVFTSDGQGRRASQAPSLTVNGAHGAGASALEVLVTGQRGLLLRAGEVISVANRLYVLPTDLHVGTGSAGTLPLHIGLRKAVADGIPVLSARPLGLWLVSESDVTRLPRGRELVTLTFTEDLR